VRQLKRLDFMRSQTPYSSTVAATGLRVMLVDLAVWPSVVFLYLLVLLQMGGVDEFVAGLFYDPSQRLFPLKHNFWAEQVLHDGGQSLMKALGLMVLAMWLASLRIVRLYAWRRTLAYVLLVMLLSVGVANLGKALSNMDCPWDLVEFGGSRLHFGLFQDKPDDLPRGRCFPGGHSSGGFALFALFFVGRSLGCQRAWLTLAPAFLIGGVFALDQWARGAHFPSHDLTTAYLCWMIALGTHAWLFRHEEGLVPESSSVAKGSSGERQKPDDGG
jgi:membrane-associated PAP2 superfamily phosphatase